MRCQVCEMLLESDSTCVRCSSLALDDGRSDFEKWEGPPTAGGFPYSAGLTELQEQEPFSFLSLQAQALQPFRHLVPYLFEREDEDRRAVALVTVVPRWALWVWDWYTEGIIYNGLTGRVGHADAEVLRAIPPLLQWVQLTGLGEQLQTLARLAGQASNPMAGVAEFSHHRFLVDGYEVDVDVSPKQLRPHAEHPIYQQVCAALQELPHLEGLTTWPLKFAQGVWRQGVWRQRRRRTDR